MYSQNKEDEIILKYFGDFIGTFADIGANDGVTLSNTRALAEKGWNGICVEPSPKAYARLKENIKGFKGVYAYPFAIGPHNGNMILHESSDLLKKGDVALVSTLVYQEMDRFKNVVSYEPVEVKVFKWKTFLNRVKYKAFDFISIDAEGLDLEILRQIDLTDVKCICVEFNGKNKEHFVAACPGFRLIHENGENLIFAR